MTVAAAPSDPYDPWFLGTPLALPRVPAGVETVTLPFTHFTVVLAPERRLAVVTAANVDGANLVEIDRGTTGTSIRGSRWRRRPGRRCTPATTSTAAT